MPETTRYLPSVTKEAKAYEIVADEEFGRSQSTRVLTVRLDPHKTAFPYKAGGEGISKLADSVESFLSKHEILFNRLPAQKFVTGDRSNLFLINHVPPVGNGNVQKFREISHLSLTISGNNGSTRATLNAEARLDDFYRLKNAILDYCMSL